MVEQPTKVFLSYALTDRAVAERIRRVLQQHSFQVFDPGFELQLGENWAERIGKELSDSDAMVVLLSSESVKSLNLRSEIGFALGSSNYQNRVIPVLIEPTEDIPWILRTFPMVKLSDSVDPGQEVLKALLGAIRGAANVM